MSARRCAAIAFLLAAVLARADEPVKGTRCFVQGEKLTGCVATSGTVVSVDPADVVRHFVWKSNDGARIVADDVAAKGTEIDLASKNLREIALKLSGDAAHGWPLDTQLRLRTDKVNWICTVPAKLTSKLASIAIPAGRYQLAAAAPHHMKSYRAFDMSKRERLDLGELKLLPLPVVSGLVVRKEEGKQVPVASASISFADGKPLTVSDGSGAFHVEMAEEEGRRTHDSVVVSAPGLSSKLVPFEQRPGDQHLGTIELGTGTRLTVELARPGLEQRSLTAELFREEQTTWEYTRIASRQVAPYANEIAFDDLIAAVYHVVIHGSEPLEVVSKTVKIEEATPASTEIEIHPFQLVGHVTRGGSPLTEAVVELQPTRTHEWRATLELKPDGGFGGTMWQHGVVIGVAMNFQTFGSFHETSPELGADPSTWNLVIPNRTISGRTLDAVTKETLPNASLSMRFTATDGGHGMSIVPVRDGRYEIVATNPGHYFIDGHAEGYMQATVTVDVAEKDGPQTADVLFEKGRSQAVQLEWPNGAPVADAYVLEGPVDGHGTFRQRLLSDATGRVTIRGTAGAAQTLYVIPVEGSIGIVHAVIGPDPDRIVHAVVPLPAGTLRVVPMTADGTRKPGGFLIRLDGDVLPYDILMNRYGPGLAYNAEGEVVLSRLPAGMYEFWSLAREEGAGNPAYVPQREASARVGLSTGDVTVKLVAP